MGGDGIERILCLASFETGHDFLRQCAEMGVRPTVLTLDPCKNGSWPQDAVESVASMPPGMSRGQILNTVSWMARGRRFDRVVALDDSDQGMAAVIREHMRIPGMGVTTTAYYRDRLAQRMSVRESGFLTPEFSSILNYDELRSFMERAPGPWLLMPRVKGSKLRKQRIENAEHLWRVLDELGDLQSRFLLEQQLAGDIFHVDAILSQCDVLFSVAQRHAVVRGSAPEAKVRTTHTLDRGSRDWMELTAINSGLAPSLGMVKGITHARYLRSRADGRYYFLEIAAGVAGVFTAETVEAASGVNLWREWARLEVAGLRGETYVPPAWYEYHAGSLACPVADEAEMSSFGAREIAARLRNGHSAGLLVRDANPQRVSELLEQFSAELARRIAAPATTRKTPAV